MRRLRDDHLNLTRRGTAPARSSALRGAFVVFLLLSVALLALSRLNHASVRDARWQLSEWMTPVLSGAAGMLDPVRHLVRSVSEFATSTGELAALRDENRRLKAAESRIDELERKLADVGALARAVAETRLPRVTAQVIASSSGSVARTVTINAGRGHAIRSGYPVLNRDGLVGRVVETGQTAARVVLLGDLTSRIPVTVGRGSVRAIVTGDGGSRLKLGYVAGGSAVAPGDDVVTSGAGGLFPRGLRIGRVVEDNGVMKVAPHAALDDLDHVSVLLYETPVIDLYGDPPASARDGGGPRPGAQPSVGIVPGRNGQEPSAGRAP